MTRRIWYVLLGGLLGTLTYAFSFAPAIADTKGQVDIMVGFRGLRSVTGGRNPSDGVDSATQRFGGTAYEHSQVSAAYQYIMQRRGSNPNATIAIVGHSAGANSAIQLARQLSGQNVRVAALVVADPSPGSARSVPGNVVQAVGLISNSPHYAGVQLSGGSPITNVKYPNLDHFGIDNKIEQHMPFVGCAPQCTYSGNSNCTYDAASGKYNCTGAQDIPTQNNGNQNQQTQVQPQSLTSGGANTNPTSSTTSPTTAQGSPTTKGIGVSPGTPLSVSEAEKKFKDLMEKTDPKKPFEVTSKKTSEVGTEESKAATASIICRPTYIRFACSAPATKSRAISSSVTGRWNTQGALKGTIRISPVRTTRYGIYCLSKEKIVAKATCTVTPKAKSSTVK